MHCRTVRAVALALASLLSLPALASGSEDRTADQLFGYSYGEAAPMRAPAADADRGADALELEFRGADGETFLDHEMRRGSRLKQLGISGTGTGASLLGLGGLLFLGSRFVDKGTTSRTALAHGGLTLVGLGGALFITGAIMLGIDASRTPRPAPTADGRGAQLIYAFAF